MFAKMNYKRRILSKYLFLRTFLLFLFVIVLPTILIYWAVTESNKSLRSGPYKTEKADEVEFYDWTPFYEKMKKKQKHLERTCGYLGLAHETASYNDYKYWNVFHLKQKSIITCDIFGISTTLFCASETSDECSTKNYLDVGLDDLHLGEYAIGGVIVFVQHPFERIVRTFKNLDVNKRSQIAMKIRSHKENSNVDEELSFEEFVEYILNSLKEYQLEEKWLPLYLTCTPCLLEFTDIIHMEEIKEEKNYLLHKAGIHEQNQKEIEKFSEMIPDASEMKFYFSQLRKDIILELYQKYRHDFELFSYQVNTYMEIGIPVPTTHQTPTAREI